jgi:TonB family protein
VSTAQRRWLAAGLSVALALVLLLVISLDNVLEQPGGELLTYRQIEVAPPSPPPPPPQVVDPSRSAESRLDVSVVPTDSPVELVVGKLDVDVAAGELTGLGDGDFGTGIGIDFGGFSLDELDAVPAVISAPPFDYPDELLEQGIESFVVYLHILIDEEGHTYLIDILENPYPPFDAELLRFAPAVRFTPPTVHGKIVKAEFSWPVKFGARTNGDGTGTPDDSGRRRRTRQPR